MVVKISLYASLRDLVGQRLVEMEIPSKTNVAGLKQAFIKKYPHIQPFQKSIIAAINQEYALDEQIIPENAEIALFPPVSGG